MLLDRFLKNKVVNKVVAIAIEDIEQNAGQPRKAFSTKELMELSDSIRSNGILQPITVQKRHNRYKIIAGERRFRAAILAGLQHVPCIVLETTDENAAVLTVLENLQRKDLTYFEEAIGYKTLLETQNLTQEELAVKLGKSQSAIANKLRLLKLTDQEMDAMIKYNLTERHARSLIRIDNIETRYKVLEQIINKCLNVAQTDVLINKVIMPDEKNGGKNLIILKDIKVFYNTINKAVDFMKKAGVNVQTRKVEVGENIEYTIIIPKKA